MRVRFSAIGILLGLLSSCTLRVYAQSEAEGYSNSYLLRPVGARTIGLAGAYTSGVNEANAVFCNAGALSQLGNNLQLSTMLSSLSYGRYQNTVALAQNVGAGIGVGLCFNSMTNPEFAHINAAGNTLGTASYREYAVGLGIGSHIGSFGFGAVAKYLSDKLSSPATTADGFAFDVGIKSPLAHVLNIGLTVQNIGSVKWNNSSATKESLPWIIRGGISTEIPLSNDDYVQRSTSLGESDTIHVPPTRYVMLALEADYARSSTCPSIVFAAELAASELLSLRAGIGLLADEFGETRFLPMSVYSGGFSYRFLATDLPFQIQLDYAASHEYSSASAITHHFSLVFNF